MPALQRVAAPTPAFPRLRGKVPEGRMGAAVWRCSRRWDSHGSSAPHPALRATFSRPREEAADCQRCSVAAPTPPFPRLRGKVPEGRMGGAVWRCSRRCDSHGSSAPHPALRATFSRPREKAADCQRCSVAAPTPPFPRLRGKARRADGGCSLAMFPQVGLARHNAPHPALRATFSRPREKATGCPRCRVAAPTPAFPRLRGKVPEGRMGERTAPPIPRHAAHQRAVDRRAGPTPAACRRCGRRHRPGRAGCSPCR